MTLACFVTVALAMGAASSLVMTVAWYIQRQSGNSGWVDVSWSLGTGGVAFTGALLPLQPDWPSARQIAVAALTLVWCLRLGLHLARRTLSSAGDPRYRDLIAKWGRGAAWRLFWFLQSQAAVGALLAIAVMVAAHNPHPGLQTQDILGLTILLAAIAGETIADAQLRKFKSDPANRHAVCDFGLWRWSRHPNYFFEWLAWLAYPTIAADFSGNYPYGWLALIAPVCMYWVLFHVSGIPPLEAHMVLTRGEKYRAYQKRTRSFFPIPLL